MAKLKCIDEIKGTLKVLESGLRIGASKENAGIGETDLPIIRHPLTQLPYVPGSSIKGKLRSLLEMKISQDTQRTGRACSCGRCLVCRLFGSLSKLADSPTRLLFRDSQPAEGTQRQWEAEGTSTEIKSETAIDRRTGRALSGSLRTTERIPAGSEFDFSFALRVFEGDDPAEFYGFLADGFSLLHQDYLGGFGSRGYGHVLFQAEDGRPLPDYLRQRAEKAGGGGGS